MVGVLRLVLRTQPRSPNSVTRQFVRSSIGRIFLRISRGIMETWNVSNAIWVEDSAVATASEGRGSSSRELSFCWRGYAATARCQVAPTHARVPPWISCPQTDHGWLRSTICSPWECTAAYWSSSTPSDSTSHKPAAASVTLLEGQARRSVLRLKERHSCPSRARPERRQTGARRSRPLIPPARRRRYCPRVPQRDNLPSTASRSRREFQQSPAHS